MRHLNQAQRTVNGRAWSLRLLVFAVLAATVHLTGTGRAQVSPEPPTRPILRIEAGQHGAMINRIDTDAANRFAVTASDDKTVRVWSLPDGRLLRTLRLPIDMNNSNAGKAFAVAMSPDGNTVAAGGWIGDSRHHDIFLFDRASGELKQRFGDLPNVVMHLAYSTDGRRLAASLGSNGVRVFDAGNGYQLLLSDTQYKNESDWARFDLAGRLVTTSDDGFVRLYATDNYAVPIAQFDSKGRLPFSAAFSPDGSRIAVGYYGVKDVDVLSGSNLKSLFKANTASVPNGMAMSKVGWSQDGRFLFAGGDWRVNGVWQVRRWSDGGRGAFVDIPTTSQTIMGILGLKAGSMLFVYANGFGLIGPDANATQLQGLGSLHFNNREKLRVSTDGSAVQVVSRVPKHTYRFALARRAVDVDPPAGDSLLAPIEKTSGLAITNWDNSRTPAVNGKPIKLKPYESSQTIAIVPNSQHFVLGADFSLRLIDRQGHEVWSEPVPGTAWEVNVSGDGRLAIVEYNDGTIRWHRVADGKELLALFIHPDGQRWIAWTPQGYYDAAAGADDLIGWHVNQGRDRAPDFYPVSQFRDHFYRPDVIERVLKTPNLDVEEAVREADKEAGHATTRAVSVLSLLRPVVEIMAPKNPADVDKTDLELTYRVQLPSPDDQLTVEARVDGVTVSADDTRLVDRGGERAGILKLTKLPRRDSMVSVLAYNKHGPSEPAKVQVQWRGPGTDPKLTLYVLAIGVSDYKDEHFRLRFPAKDAGDFVAVAKAQEGEAGLYEKVITHVLRNREATKNNILLELDWIRRAVTNTNDVAMIFMAGHGKTGDTGDRPYRFLPYDYDADQEIVTTIRDTDFKDFLTEIGGKKILFLDTCFSGAFRPGSRDIGTQQPDVDKFANELRTAENGIVVFTSSTGHGLSQEDEKWNNGAFTKALVEGLKGAAAQPRVGVVTINGLSRYVSQQVRDLTGGNQKPMMAMPTTVEDYPISRRLQ
jgi:WD40 repeat protein